MNGQYNYFLTQDQSNGIGGFQGYLQRYLKAPTHSHALQRSSLALMQWDLDQDHDGISLADQGSTPQFALWDQAMVFWDKDLRQAWACPQTSNGLFLGATQGCLGRLPQGDTWYHLSKPFGTTWCCPKCCLAFLFGVT